MEAAFALHGQSITWSRTAWKLQCPTNVNLTSFPCFHWRSKQGVSTNAYLVNSLSFSHSTSSYLAWMRFKPDGCGYDDDITWFSKEMIAYNRQTGFLFGESDLASDLAQILYLDHIDNNGCVQKAGPWAFFELTFALGRENFIWDWFNSRLETYHMWKESVRFTATTNSNPSDVNHINANAYWSEFKT